MSPPLAHTVTEEEAIYLRWLVERVGVENIAPDRAQLRNEDETGRIWSPIDVVEQPTGRARCRLCSNAIAKGERCVKFGFDPYGEGSWGKLSAAYLHLTCPETEGGTT